MSKPNLPKLPAEAIKFAKSMGLDLNGLEPEAEDIWKMLDDMSTRDPLQYEAFVSQQFESAKEGGDKGTKPEDEKRSFRPAAGYCVETTSLSGDGLKIRDASASTGKKFFINLCSSTVIEEPTDKAGKVIKGDRSVADGLNIPLIVGPVRPADASSAEKDRELYVDVVLHPRVIELAQKEKFFKAQIVDLALEWVIQETKVDCDRKWSHVTNCTYKGGRGDKREVPVLFFVDSTGAPVGATPFDTASTNSASATPSPLASTSSLLSQIHKDKQGQQDAATEKVDIFAASSTTKSSAAKSNNPAIDIKTDYNKQEKNVTKEAPAVPKKALIQEIGAPSPKSPFDDQPVQKQPVTVGGATKEKKSDFGAGFLTARSATSTASKTAAATTNPGTSSVKPLKTSVASSTAPTAQPTATPPVPPGAVPLAKHTTLQELLHPTSTTNTNNPSLLPTPPTASNPSPTMNPTSNPTTATSITTTTATAKVKEPTKMEYLGMEKLLSSFDEGFGSTSAQESNFMDTEASNSIIADLAKMLSGGDSGLLGPAPAHTATISSGTTASSAVGGVSRSGDIEDQLVFSNGAPGVVTITAKTEREAESPFAVLVLSIAGLSSSLDTATMELLVSYDEVIVTVDKRHLAGTDPTQVTAAADQRVSFGAKYAPSGGSGGGYVLREGSAAAGFKKKKGVLTVKIHYT